MRKLMRRVWKHLCFLRYARGYPNNGMAINAVFKIELSGFNARCVVLVFSRAGPREQLILQRERSVFDSDYLVI